MSKEQAIAFRTFVNENESVQEQISKGATDGSLKLTKLVAEHGLRVHRGRIRKRMERSAGWRTFRLRAGNRRGRGTYESAARFWHIVAGA